MSWKGLTIWLIDEGRDAEAALRLLKHRLGVPGLWAQWRVIAGMEHARAHVAQSNRDSFPHVAVITSAAGGKAAEQEREEMREVLRRKARDLGVETWTAIVLRTRSRGRAAIDVVARHTAEQIELACAEVARQLLQAGEVPVPAGAPVELASWLELLNEGSMAIRDAQAAFESEVKIPFQGVLSEALRKRGNILLLEDLTNAKRPFELERIVESCDGALAENIKDELHQQLERVKPQWRSAEAAATKSTSEVWRLFCGETYLELWRLAPFAGQRKTSSRGAFFYLDELTSSVRDMSELLERETDHALALTRLFKRMRIAGERRLRPATFFATMLHSIDREGEAHFRKRFGLAFPEKEQEQELFLRAELYGEAAPSCPAIRRVHLPTATVDRIKSDGLEACGGSERRALVSFCNGDALSGHWYVEPKYYMQSWPELQDVALSVSGASDVNYPKVLSDWRHVHQCVGSVVARLRRPLTVAGVNYGHGFVDLRFEAKLMSFTGLPGLRPAGGNGLGDAFHDLRGWCWQVELETNDPAGQCYSAIHGKTDWMPNGAQRADPFFKFTVRLPHYNETRERRQ